MKISKAMAGFFAHAGQALLIGAFTLLVLGVGCSSSHNGTIPITTSSERAREYFRLGWDLAERLRPLEARQYYNEAISLDSNFALAYLYLAKTKSTTDDRLRLLNKAASFIGQVSEGERLMILARQAKFRGNRLQERDYYRQLEALYPEDERVHNLFGNYYLNVQEYEQAIIEYRHAIEINPKFFQAYNGLGYAYGYLGNYTDAEKTFLKYIELIPNDPNPYDSYAELLLRMGRFAESLTYYQKALQKNPYFLNAYEGMASVYNYMGQHNEARAQLEILFDRARTLARQRLAYFGLAVSYADEGNLDSALAKIRKSYALSKRAKDVLAIAEDLNNMGHILLQRKKSGEALEKYKQAAKLVKRSSLAQEIKENARCTYIYNATRVAIHRGDSKTAQNYADEFRKLTVAAHDPALVELSHELAGTIALIGGKYQTAVTELQQSNLQDPYNLQRLAQAYQESGNQEEAQETRNKVATFYADNSLNHAFIRGKANRTLAAREPD